MNVTVPYCWLVYEILPSDALPDIETARIIIVFIAIESVAFNSLAPCYTATALLNELQSCQLDRPSDFPSNY